MVNGQITSKGKRVDYGKTDAAAIRPIALPDWAAALLRRRKVAQAPNDLDAVFVTRNGTWHYPTNIQGRLRHIRLLDDYAGLTVLQGVTAHSFRRTVATEIDEVHDAEAAKNQLGHTSKTVTERHYINRRLVVPDYRAATERLAPGSGAGHGTGPAK
jgi:integrase